MPLLSMRKDWLVLTLNEHYFPKGLVSPPHHKWLNGHDYNPKTDITVKQSEVLVLVESSGRNILRLHKSIITTG